MKTTLRRCLLASLFISAHFARGQYAWTNFAGTPSGIGSADGTGTAARFYTPTGTAIDSTGNVYMTDRNNHTIRKVTSAGVVTTLAGSAGISGTADGTGGAARFTEPVTLAIDSAATNLYVTDSSHTIRKVVIATGVVTTLAGSPNISGSADGTGSAARFDAPVGVAIDSTNANLYVSDSGHTIRKVVIATGVVTTIAGTAGSSGNANGTGAAARFDEPTGVALDNTGTILYVSDLNNNSIRKIILSTGVVSRLAGSATSLSGSADGTADNARFNEPAGVAVDGSGNVYVADSQNYCIRKVTSAGVVTTLAGSPLSQGVADGPGATARFFLPGGVALNAAGTLAVGDQDSQAIRTVNISTGVVATLAGFAPAIGSTNATGSAARFYFPSGVTVDSTGNVYVSDSFNHTIRKITSAGVVSLLAGTVGVSGNTNATGAAAKFNFPEGLAVDSSGNVFVADAQNHLIRKITAAGVVTTLAGSAGNPGSANGTGVAAQFNIPLGVALDTSGNVYVTDSGNGVIRKITAAGVVTTLAGSAGQLGNSDGVGSVARFTSPNGIAIDASGNLYVADQDSNFIRKITPAGLVTTLAGSNDGSGFQNGAGNNAMFNEPNGVAVDAAGNVYVADQNNNAIRKVSAAGVVTTIGGSPAGQAGSADGLGSAARFYAPEGIAISSTGILYVGDSRNHRITKGAASAVADISVSQNAFTILTDGIESADFGSNSTAGPITQTFTITNSGTASLTSLVITKNGTNSADFTVSALGATTLAVGASTTFTVSFTPAALGVRQAALHIASNVTGAASSFDINVNGTGVTAPANNNFASRINLGSAAAVNTTGTNVGATMEAGELTYGNLAGASVWYEWTAPATGWTTIHTVGSALDTVIALYTGTTLAGLSELGFNDSSSRSDDFDDNGDPSRLVFFAQSGTSYKIAVGGYVSLTPDRDAFELHIAAEPTPAFRITAITATPNPATVTTAEKDITLQVSVTSTEDLFPSGLGYVYAQLNPPNNTGTASAYINYQDSDRTSGTSFTGTYQQVVTIPRYVAGGNWSYEIGSGIGDIRWTSPGNDLIQDFYIIPSTIASTLAVVNAGSVDTTAATLTNITGIPATVNVSAGDVSFNVDVAFTDAISGLVYLDIFANSAGQNSGFSLGDNGSSPFLLSGTINNGVYRFPVTIHQGTTTGIYFIGVAMTDGALNYVNYSDTNSDHPIPTASGGHSFQIIGINPAPDIAVVQDGLDLTDGSDIVDFGTVASPASQTLTFQMNNYGTSTLSNLQITVDGTNSTEFVVSGLSDNFVTPYNSATFSVTFTPGGNGVRSAVLHIASNVAGSKNPFDVLLSGTGSGVTAVQSWRQDHFFSTANTGNGANAADPNNNGILNLMEYALNGDPSGATTGVGILPVVSQNPTTHHLQFVFTRYVDRNDITLTVQGGATLNGPWTDLARSVNGAAFTTLAAGATATETGAGNARVVTVGDPFLVTDPAHPRRFMKLLVTSP